MKTPAALDAPFAPYRAATIRSSASLSGRTGGLLRSRAALSALQPDGTADLSIVYGCGTALVGWQGHLVWRRCPQERDPVSPTCRQRDLPGRRPAARSQACLQAQLFIDWVVANRHKLYPAMSASTGLWMASGPKRLPCAGQTIRSGLEAMAHSFFRARPWFEPGPWGGQWICRRMPQLAQDVPNYAWSFEICARRTAWFRERRLAAGSLL